MDSNRIEDRKVSCTRPMDRQTSNRRSAFTLIEPFGFAQGKLPVVRKCRRTGFTLIELLVVIAIIALLVSMLMPSLNRAKEMARAVLCLNNAKNIGMSLQLYATDYNDTYMRNTVYVPIPDGTAAPSASSKWEIQLIRLGYIGSKDPDYRYSWINSDEHACGALLCPTTAPESRQDKSSYAMNGRQTAFPLFRSSSSPYYIEDRRTPSAWINLGDLSKPFDMVYVFCADSRYGGFYGGPVEFNSGPWLAPGDFHSGNTNILMADFHVTTADKYDMIEYPHNESPFIWDR